MQEENAMYKNILVAYDNSEWADLALEKAVELGKIWESRIIVFHSIFNEIRVLRKLNFPIIPGPGDENFFPTYDEGIIPDIYANLGRNVIEKAKKKLDGTGLDYRIELIEDLRPVEAAITLVNKWDVELVLVGAHGSHGTFGRLFLGSVSMRIANRVPVSTLIIRLPKKRREELKTSINL